MVIAMRCTFDPNFQKIKFELQFYQCQKAQGSKFENLYLLKYFLKTLSKCFAGTSNSRFEIWEVHRHWLQYLRWNPNSECNFLLPKFDIQTPQTMPTSASSGTLCPSPNTGKARWQTEQMYCATLLQIVFECARIRITSKALLNFMLCKRV
jgi:hypothetical protein